VVRTGVGVSANGSPVIEVYLESDAADDRAKLAPHLETVPVRSLVTGRFEAY
jgi:hypothetical protein